MTKTFVGPQLRQLRRERHQTQAEMAKVLGVSPGYVNLLENNERSLSLRVLMALADHYGVDWRDIVADKTSNLLAELRSVIKDPMFSAAPDLIELRAAIDHAPRLVEQFLYLYGVHRNTLERLMREGSSVTSVRLLATSAEAVLNTHGIRIKRRATEEMTQALRVYDKENRVVYLSEALDYSNVLFQLAHVVCLIELQDLLNKLTAGGKIKTGTSLARCHVELANYFAAAFLVPYEPFLREAESMWYDIDRLAARFGVSFEQTCHRLTTLQRPGAQGVPFFFLRVDKAGNVTKRFNSTSFHLAEYGGACPVWKVHMAFRLAGVIIPQFVELPDGDRFFTISRTVDRPTVNFETQDHRLAVSLGCELQHAKKLGYAAAFNLDDERIFSRIGINCHVCPRQACSQRAHQPLFMDLPLDTNRRGKTRYES